MSGVFFRESGPDAGVYRYYSAALAARWGAKVRFLPLGYASGHARTGAVQPASARPVAWAFVGDVRGKPTRVAALASLGAGVPRGVAHVTSRATTGRPWRPDVWAAPAVAALHGAAVFCPAPPGFESPESFRVWEALEAGCLPLVDARDGYFLGLLDSLGARLAIPRLAADLLPVPPVDDWAAADAAVAAVADVDAAQAASSAAWRRLKAALNADADAALDEAARAAAAPMAVFVAIPKTGTRAVLAALLKTPGLSVYQGRLQQGTACREYGWWAALRAGADVRYDGRDYRGGVASWAALRRDCARATTRVAESVGRHFDDPVVFFDHVGYLPDLAGRAAHVTVRGFRVLPTVFFLISDAPHR